MTKADQEALEGIGAKVKEVKLKQRTRTGYPAVLQAALIDFAEVLLDDDDLEPAVLGLMTLARERGYQLQGTDEQILASLRRMAV